MSDSFIFNYDKNNNVTVAGYEIDSKLMNAMRSPISTINFSKNKEEIKSMADIFKGKIVPAGLFSAPPPTPSCDGDRDFLDDLKDLVRRPIVTLDKASKASKKNMKTKKRHTKKNARKTKRKN